MKLFQDYKKQFKILFFLIFFCIPFFSLAQNVVDLQNKINAKDLDITNLEQEIKNYQNQLDDIGQQKNTLAKSITELDLNKKKLNADLSLTQKKIDKVTLTIDNLNLNINNKQEAISNNRDSIFEQIKNINEMEQDNIMTRLLSEKNFITVWNDIDNIISINEKIRKNILNLKEIKGELENTKKDKVIAKSELLVLKSQLSDQQKIIIQNTNEKNKLLKQTKNNELVYQKLLKDRINKRDAFEQELRDYESQLKFILDPSKLPSSKVLSWPLEKVYVTQLFGKTVDSRRLYASGTHNGVDFRASVGTPIFSMADGTVLGIGDTDLACYGASFGKFVFIQYNNGLSSTFGHLSLIKVKEGDKVQRGEIVGYSGSTGHATGPHLHVSLYASSAVKMASKPSAACGGRIYTLPVAPINAYLDVLYYLPVYNVNTTLLNNKVGE